MIPISAETTLAVVDDKTENTYYLRYLIENDKQAEYSALARAEKKQIDDIVATMPVLSDDATDEQRTNQRIEAYGKFREENIGSENNYETMSKYIDIFVVGWKGPKLPSFPTEVKPSTMLPFFKKIKLYNIVQEHIDELTGLSVDEIKN